MVLLLLPSGEGVCVRPGLDALRSMFHVEGFKLSPEVSIPLERKRPWFRRRRIQFGDSFEIRGSFRTEVILMAKLVVVAY